MAESWVLILRGIQASETEVVELRDRIRAQMNGYACDTITVTESVYAALTSRPPFREKPRVGRVTGVASGPALRSVRKERPL